MIQNLPIILSRQQTQKRYEKSLNYVLPECPLAYNQLPFCDLRRKRVFKNPLRSHEMRHIGSAKGDVIRIVVLSNFSCSPQWDRCYFLCYSFFISITAFIYVIFITLFLEPFSALYFHILNLKLISLFFATLNLPTTLKRKSIALLC